MSRPWLEDAPARAEARGRETRQAQIASFERQTPINTAVTVAASLCTLPLAWGVVPTPWLAAWLLVQVATPCASFYRWAVRRRRGREPSGSMRSIRWATAWALTGGLLWGSTLLFMPVMPPANRLGMTIVVGAMAAGASTTLAAIPSAARSFILAALLPAAVAFVAIGDGLHVSLGALAVIMALAMLAASGIVHRQFVETLVARQETAKVVEQYRQSQTEWLQLTDTAEGFALVDREGCLLLWNAGFGRALGLAAAELSRGRPYRQLLQLATPSIEVTAGHGSRQEWIERQMAMQAEPGGAIEQQMSDGSWLRSSTRRALDDAVLITHVDITELKRREEALRASEARFRAVTDSTPEAIVTVDGAGRIVFCNRMTETLFGYPADELIGRPIATLMREQDGAAYQPTAFHALSQGRAIETEGRRKDGGRITVDWAVSRWQHDGTTYYTNVLRDSAERKRAEGERASLQEQFHQAQKFQALGTLAGGVAHDFNNILGIVVGHAEVIEDGLPAASGLRANVEKIFRACERGSGLVRQILAFSRRDRQALEPVRLDTLLADELRLLRASMPATIELASRIAPDLTIRGDRTQLHQIVVNLCVNASLAIGSRPGRVDIALDAVEVNATDRAVAPLLEAGRTGDSVALGSIEQGATHAMWLGTLAAGAHIRLSVRDNGVGMEPSVLERIFDPFFTTRDVGRGTGLGLAAVRGIVSGMGGAVVVRTAPGQGTRFDLYFPRSIEPEAMANRQSVPARAVGRGRRVLFVDDEPALVEAAERQLAAMGFAVVAVDHPTAALRRFRESPGSWDLVITDNSMPQTTGIELAQEISALRPGLPIIMCTGHDDALGSDIALDAGIRQVLMKPVNSAALATAIAKVLLQAPATRQEREAALPKAG